MLKLSFTREMPSQDTGCYSSDFPDIEFEADIYPVTIRIRINLALVFEFSVSRDIGLYRYLLSDFIRQLFEIDRSLLQAPVAVEATSQMDFKTVYAHAYACRHTAPGEKPTVRHIKEFLTATDTKLLPEQNALDYITAMLPSAEKLVIRIFTQTTIPADSGLCSQSEPESGLCSERSEVSQSAPEPSQLPVASIPFPGLVAQVPAATVALDIEDGKPVLIDFEALMAEHIDADRTTYRPTIAVATLGDRKLTYFFTDRPPSAALLFRNSYNAPEYFYSFGFWAQELKPEFTEVTAAGQHRLADFTNSQEFIVSTHHMDALEFERIADIADADKFQVTLYRGSKTATFSAIPVKHDIDTYTHGDTQSATITLRKCGEPILRLTNFTEPTRFTPQFTSHLT